jgi:molybdopterin synthase catalytic subunit
MVTMKFRRGFRAESAVTVRSNPGAVTALFGVAILLAFLSSLEIGYAVDPKDPVPLVIDFRKEIPPVVSRKILDDATAALPKAGEDELKADEAEGERLHRAVMAKFRKVERNSQLVTVLGGEPMFRLPYFTLTMASLGLERHEKMADLQRRERAAMDKAFPGSTAEHPVGYSSWAQHPDYKPFEQERERIKAWFKQSVEEERRKYKEGDSEAAQTLEKLRQETVDEMGLISAFQRAVRNERHKRKGEPIEKDWDDIQFEEDMRKTKEKMEKAQTETQHRRLSVRVVAVRTEYEVRPNEAAFVIFQVFRGRPTYLLDLKAPGAGQGRLWLNQSTAGEFQFPLMYAKAGTYQATLTVMDADWESASATVTITVKGDPVPVPKDEEQPAKKIAVKTTPTPTPLPPAPGPAPVPIVGTFSAMFWRANATIFRWDQFGQPGGPTLMPVPLQITLDPSGAIRGSVNYELPASEMVARKDAKFGIYWRSRFDVEGKVDWKTGATHIDIKNGHDESGYEENVPNQGHWTNLTIKNYTTTLDGWTIPGPDADGWLKKLPSVPGIMSKLGDLEKGGHPAVVTGANGQLAFRDRGFLGAPDLPVKPGGIVHRRIQYTSCLYRYGPDNDMTNSPVMDRVKEEQAQAEKNAQQAWESWYLKILGPATPEADAGAKKGDIQAFGLWPTKPVRLKVGGTAKASAMAVYRQNVYDAVDLSAKVTWTSNGLEMLGNGTFRATKPGTYTITARTNGGPEAMSSTLQVIVEP